MAYRLSQKKVISVLLPFKSVFVINKNIGKKDIKALITFYKNLKYCHQVITALITFKIRKRIQKLSKSDNCNFNL